VNSFIGRELELEKLKALSQKKTASFILIRGRRRIGKSRLAEEFSKNFDYFYRFEGLTPQESTTTQDQLSTFSKQLSFQFKAPKALYSDWTDALQALGERVSKGKTLILFDEISWMSINDPTFLAKIKIFWDQQLKQNPQLVFIICGSASAWIDKNILSNSGFVGRISYTLTLEELPLSDCSKFWPKKISAHEKLKVLAVTGGIPKYLEEINPKLSAEENIKQLCFTKGAFLVEEFNQIFSDLFLRDSVLYKKIIETLSDGPKERNKICEILGIQAGGRITEYLWELELSGFITRDPIWSLNTGEDSKLSQYRLSDNYLRFYLKYIEKNLSKINRDSFNFKSLALLPEWKSLMGLQIENLIVNNKTLIHAALKIHPNEIINENPYYQRKTSRYEGCQIDYLIQTSYGTLYLCEIKFSQNPIGMEVIQEVEKKIKALHCPRNYSYRPVLIHVNGVTEDLIAENYFVEIIDLSKFL